jgi:hypothetical protein
MAEGIPDGNQAGEALKEQHPSRQRLILAFDRELPSSELTAVLHHIELCAVCEARFAKLAKLSDGIAAVEPEDGAPVFELKLPSVSEVHPFPSKWSGPPLMKTLGLIAAVVTLAVGLWLLMRSPSQSRPAVAAAGGNTGEGRKGSVTHPKLDVSNEDQTPRRAVVQHLRRARPNSRVTTPMAANTTQRDPDSKVVFWALPYSNPVLTAEGEHVVHVGLPREAFLMAGVPVAELPGVSQRELVPAEVLLGSDGLPSAIRPIQYKASRRQVGYNAAP